MSIAVLVGKCKNFWGKLIPSEEEARFISHNRRVWSDSGESTPTKEGEVLFELNSTHSAIIAYSYLANILAKKHSSKIVSFSYRQHGWKNFLSGLFRLPYERVFSSFGTELFLNLNLSRSQRERSKELFAEVYASLKNERDIENIIVDEVWIGDLIYDSYLRENSVPTIDICEDAFVRSLRKSLEIYVFWRDYMNMHPVKAINVSHCVYNLAIPLRVAISRGIPAYQINASHVYHLSEHNLYAYNDFFKFRELFHRLPTDVQLAGLEHAKQRIELRFGGKVGVDMGYSTKSAYGEHKGERLLEESVRTKILIATHCFFDSPHSYGRNLFPDFYTWLDFLGGMTLDTDYDWYIKTHPDYLAGTKEIIDSFIKKYPKFHLLPADSSHHQIIDEGINVALTTYGTIGFEYAALDIPVINASVNNPHIAYNFNIHPKSVEEYREILKNLDQIDLKIDKKEVYEYYFMKHIYNINDWLFDSYTQMVEDLGGYSEQFTSRVYKYWIHRWTPGRHAEILAALNSFIDSGDFRLGNKHLGRDFEMTVERD